MKIVLGLLALTFVVFFGASDFGGGHGGGQSSRNTNALLEVDNVDFSLHQIGREFNSQIQRVSQATGQPFSLQSPLAPALLDQTIQAMVTRTLYDLAARDLGVSASDNAVRSSIVQIPAFAGPNGSFDPSLFSTYLLHSGISEAQFIAGAREDLRRNQYLGSLTASIAAPDAMVDAVYRYRAERRIADLVTISAASIDGVGTPGDAELSKFYEENELLFEAPEYRSATLIALTVEELASNINVDEQEIADLYANRIDLFRQGERREILQGIFLDEESAKKAHEAIAQGRPFAEVVEEIAGFPPVSMGTVQRTEITEADLAEAAFSTGAGAVAGPIETDLGWQLLSVISVLPEQTQPLEEVSDNLRQVVALEQARDEIFDVLADIEDSLAAGSTLEEIARNVGVDVQRIDAFNAGGLSRGSGESVSFEALPELVNAVFTTEEGEVGEVVETRTGGFFVARTDSIIPPQVEPLDQVRDRVVNAWTASERIRIATERANTIVDRARAGGDLAKLAKDFGATFEITQPFDRTGQGSTIAGPLITPIFDANEGDIVQAETETGVSIARLVEIEKIEGGDDFERDEVRLELAQAINGDIAAQLTAALRERYSVDIDVDTIEESLLPQ